MAKLRLTLAVNDYDHVRDLVSGKVRPEGIELNCLTLSVEEIFYRFLRHREWHVSEFSLGMAASAISRGDAPFVAIPVFPSRVFRLSSIFVRRDGAVRKPEDLAGRRIGVPEWSQTAGIYTRGWLMHEAGVPLSDVAWFQGGVNHAGRTEASTLNLPDGVSLSRVADRSLTAMLLDGDIDAMFTAHLPDAYRDGDPGIVRLFDDYRAAEQAYFEKTGIFPIMHTVVIRREVFDDHPWVAMSLYKAFDEARRRGIRRLTDVTTSQIAVPWGFQNVEAVGRLVFGEDAYWPYGVEPNRVTLDAFLQFSFEQGVCHRRLEPEDLYPPEVQAFFRV